MEISSTLQLKLKKCDIEVQHFVRALQSELTKTQRQNAKLEVDNLRLRIQAEVMRKELKTKFQIEIESQKPNENLRELLEKLLKNKTPKLKGSS